MIFSKLSGVHTGFLKFLTPYHMFLCERMKQRKKGERERERERKRTD